MEQVAITIQETTEQVTVTVNETTEVVNITVTETVTPVTVTIAETGVIDNSTVTLIAGQNLSAGRVVILDNDRVFYFQNTDRTHQCRAFGITTTSATSGNTVTVAVFGLVQDSSFGFTQDTTLWVGDDGTIYSTQPATGVLIQSAGVAYGDKKVRIDFSLSLYKN